MQQSSRRQFWNRKTRANLKNWDLCLRKYTLETRCDALAKRRGEKKVMADTEGVSSKASEFGCQLIKDIGNEFKIPFDGK